MNNFDVALWIITPISGAIIGYSTNCIAIKMLFRPLYEKRLFGIKLPFTPGLIPKERNRISQKLAETIGTHLLTEQALTEALGSDKMVAGITEVINSAIARLEDDTNTIEYYLRSLLKEQYSEEVVCRYLKQMLAKTLPGMIQTLEVQIKENGYINDMAHALVVKLVEENAGKLLGLFLNPDKIYESMKKSILEYLSGQENQDKIYEKLCGIIEMAPESELKESILSIKVSDITLKFISPNKQKILDMSLTAIKPLLAKAAAYAANSLDIEEIVVDKMNNFGVHEAEEIIISIVDKELKAITLLGGFLGFVIGLLPAVLKILGF